MCVFRNLTDSKKMTCNASCCIWCDMVWISSAWKYMFQIRPHATFWSQNLSVRETIVLIHLRFYHRSRKMLLERGAIGYSYKVSRKRFEGLRWAQTLSGLSLAPLWAPASEEPCTFPLELLYHPVSCGRSQASDSCLQKCKQGQCIYYTPEEQWFLHLLSCWILFLVEG